MHIQRIENNNNPYLSKNSNPQNFNGRVSRKFIKYVNTLRKDCLEVVPEQNVMLINNICDGIIDRAETVMKKCFDRKSVLSVDTTMLEDCDIIFVQNKIINKYIGGPAYDQGFVSKGESIKPIERLKMLHGWIKGKYRFFREAYGKNIYHIGSAMYWPPEEIVDKYSVDAYKDIIKMLTREKKCIRHLPSESPRDKNTKIDCYELLISRLTPIAKALETFSKK